MLYSLYDNTFFYFLIYQYRLSLNKRPGACMESKLNRESLSGRRAINRGGHLLFYLTDSAVVEASNVINKLAVETAFFVSLLFEK